MLDVSEIIQSPEFLEPIVIKRTVGGHYEKTKYIGGEPVIINATGVCVSPKGTKSIDVTPQGNRASGAINVYVDASVMLYTTDKSDNHDTSDIIIRNYGQPNQAEYRVNYVNDYSRYGYNMAEAQRMGGI